MPSSYFESDLKGISSRGHDPLLANSENNRLSLCNRDAQRRADQICRSTRETGDHDLAQRCAYRTALGEVRYQKANHGSSCNPKDYRGDCCVNSIGNKPRNQWDNCTDSECEE